MSQTYHIAVIDTETTGLYPTSDRLVEVAVKLLAIDASGQLLEEVAVYESLHDPGIRIPRDPITSSRYHRTLRALFDEFYGNRLTAPISAQLVLREKSVPEYETTPGPTASEHKAQSLIAARHILPPNGRLTVIATRQRNQGEKLHDRFALSELGGVQFSVGLDDGEPGETDTAALMSRVTYLEQWRKYYEELAFDVVEKWTIDARGLAVGP